MKRMLQALSDVPAAGWRWLRAASTAGLLAASAGALAQEPGRVVEVEGGALRGVVAGDVELYRGIPYAAPPVGELRWRVPQPAAAWTGIRDAAAFGMDCTQSRPRWDKYHSGLPVGEDCLTLNVWRPRSQAQEPLPVMVWIHGGGFVMGSGSQPVVDGAALARRGIVLVTFNYRLGRFGFFAHPALAGPDQEASGGNYGLLDQVAALRWVQRNIGAFGGDPGNVTVFGESAGATSILHLMLMPQAQGLFQRAIVSSSAGRDPWPLLDRGNGLRPSALAIGERFAAKAGLKQADAARLRALPAARLVDGLQLFDMQEDTFSGPIIDGRVVAGTAVAGFAAGRQARIPLLIGANSMELGLLPGFIRSGIARKFLAQLPPERRQLQGAYRDRKAFDVDFISDFAFVEPARRIADLAARAGMPVYLYRFDYVPEERRRQAAGASHASDVPFVFDTLDVVEGRFSAADRAQARLVGDYWTGFARRGDPNGEGRPPWPAYAGDSVAFNLGADAAAPRALDARALDAIAAAHDGP